MLDKALSDNVIIEYKDIFQQSIEDGVTSPTQLPYFEGDFWPNIIEESIREITQEEEERKKTEAAQAAQMEAENSEDNQIDMIITSTGQKAKGNSKRGNKKTNKKNKTNKTPAKKPVANTMGTCELSNRIFATMDKYKEVFFCDSFLSKWRGAYEEN